MPPTAADDEPGSDDVLSLLDPNLGRTPPTTRCQRAWAATKLALGVLVLLPVRVALLLTSLLLMCVVCLFSVLLGCASCRRGPRLGALSVRPKNCGERAVLRLLSPLCRLTLFALGFVYIRERRVEVDGTTPRLQRRCWQRRPSPAEKATAAATAQVASAVASRSGTKKRPAATVPVATPPREGMEQRHVRLRTDPAAAAAGSTIICNHTSMADVLYIVSPPAVVGVGWDQTAGSAGRGLRPRDWAVIPDSAGRLGTGLALPRHLCGRELLQVHPLLLAGGQGRWRAVRLEPR